MKIRISQYILAIPAFMLLLGACTQTTPSMMNTSRIESIQGSTIEQVPLADLDEASIAVIAEQHRRYGVGPLDLTMTFDPKSKDFTAMKAVQMAKSVQSSLNQKGVSNISVQTMAVSEGTPSLVVAYDTVQVQAPSDCALMPGIDSHDTTRFIEEYKFGCSVETMLSKQIARPKDLTGNADLDTRGGRREAIVTDGYSAGVPREPLQGLERANLSSN